MEYVNLLKNNKLPPQKDHVFAKFIRKFGFSTRIHPDYQQAHILLKNLHFKIETCFSSDFNHAYIDLDNAESQLRAGLAIKPVTVWIACTVVNSHHIFNKIMSTYEKKQIGIHLYDNIVCWNLWKDPSSWSSKAPKWRQGSINILDLLFGKEQITENDTSKAIDIEFPMPEGNYLGDILMKEITYDRPRWPGKRSKSVAYIKLKDGIPYHHNSDKVVDNLTTQARNPGEAVGEFVKFALKKRWKQITGKHPEQNWYFLSPKDQKFKNILK